MKNPTIAIEALFLCVCISNVSGFKASKAREFRCRLQMGYLDDLSPTPKDEKTSKKTPPNKSASRGVVPSGRGPLGSYLDEVTSGRSSNDKKAKMSDSSFESSPREEIPVPKPASWTNTYLSNFLTDDDPRTDIRNLLTQRAIQSFMRLLEECRDPHSAKWIEQDFLQTGNLLDFHGTGAKFIEQFGGTWDAPILEMIARPKDRLIVSAKRRGRGHGGWSKNNPYLEERWMELAIDIDPANLATRILAVREQLAKEWLEDLDALIEANDGILGSFFRGNEGGFTRTAANKANNNLRFGTISSSLYRRGNFDVLYNLCTQAAIHRILRQMKANHEENETGFIFLKDYYTARAAEYFDGDLQYGRADDFIDDLLQTSPSFSGQNVVDPVGAVEDIIHMRKVVAEDWKLMMGKVPEEHIGIRQALLSNSFTREDSDEKINYDDLDGFQ